MPLEEWEIKELPYDPRKRPDSSLALPDLSEAVIGWRAWRVDVQLPRYGLPPKLYSASFDYYWTPRRAAKAECDYGGGCEGDELPGETCACGFYSAKSLKHLLSMGYAYYDAEYDGKVCVVGKVACWGKVIEGGQGWRSSYAYPVALYVPFETAHLAKPLQEAYGAKTTLLNWMNGELG